MNQNNSLHKTRKQVMSDKPHKSSGKGKRTRVCDIYNNAEDQYMCLERAGMLLERLDAALPKFVKCMLPSNVLYSFWLILPKKFCIMHLPEHDTTVTLVDEFGKEFETKYLKARCGLSGGWRGFSIAQKLLQGDILLFHLVGSCKLQVHIVRRYGLEAVEAAVCLMEMHPRVKRTRTLTSEKPKHKKIKKGKRAKRCPKKRIAGPPNWLLAQNTDEYGDRCEGGSTSDESQPDQRGYCAPNLCYQNGIRFKLTKMVALKKKNLNYEDSRQKRLEENKKRMEELKLTVLAQSLRTISTPKPSPMKKVNRTPRKPLDMSAVRRSNRVADKPPANYKEVPIEPLGIRRSYGKTGRDLSNRVYASYEDREYATGRADDLHSTLQSDFPSFVKPMLQSHVSGGFWLGLPVHFCKSYLPKRDEIMTLVDEDEAEWQTRYLHKKTGLSGGWKRFAEDHKLADGDALVFELIKLTVFKVYIIRVNQAEDSEEA